MEGKSKDTCLEGRKREEKVWVCSREREFTLGPSSHGFYLVFKGELLGEVLGEDLSRILNSFPGVSCQGHGLY